MPRRETDGAAIVNVWARQILDSRGNPTVEAEVKTRSSVARASVPSGASTGSREALELRDGGKKFHGKGVAKAVSNVNNVIGPRLKGIRSTAQARIDALMIGLDGTPNKSRLGANAILAVSMASARAASISEGKPLFNHLRPAPGYRLPVPMMNVINGGEHADNGLSIQEFLIEPIGAGTCTEAVRMGVEVYQSLKEVLKQGYGPGAVNVGDEGGFAPPMTRTSEALEAIAKAIRKSGYTEGDVRMGIDAAATTFFHSPKKEYDLDGTSLAGQQLEDVYAGWCAEFGLLTIEDPFGEAAFDEFASLTRRVRRDAIVVGDDIYVTNASLIKKGIRLRATNSVLIKLNQIGTVSETIDAIEVTKSARWEPVISHRSGETEDPFIAHLATAFDCAFIKAGAPARGERTSKYNELLRIEEGLGGKARFAGPDLARGR